ncbi:MAG: hypothetical protein Ta2B_05750 [Termitinemataceae bacterium]|nr:MAG: hypothetical protein Ta2B_05750 [Termitinemataceae bacterium]
MESVYNQHVAKERQHAHKSFTNEHQQSFFSRFGKQQNNNTSSSRTNVNQNEKINIYKATLYTGIGFIVLAAIITFSLSASLFKVPEIPSPIGDFFANSYGVLAFIIPVYLVCSALVLFDSGYRPDRIFVLNSIIFPFFTLSVGFSFIRDFAYYQDKFPFLGAMGKNGFSFIMIFLTVMESLVIASLNSTLFPSPVKVRTRQHSAASTNQNIKTRLDKTAEPTENNKNVDANSSNDEIKIIRVPAERKIDPKTFNSNNAPSVSIIPDILNEGKFEIQPTLSFAGLQAVKDAYTEAFEQLQEMQEFCGGELPPSFQKQCNAEARETLNETGTVFSTTPRSPSVPDEVDIAFGKLDPGLQDIQCKLSNLDNDYNDIDGKFEKLDAHLQTLKDELNKLSGNTSFNNTDGTNDSTNNISEQSQEACELDSLNGLDLSDDLQELAGTDELEPAIEDADFEQLIKACEAEAAIKTEQAIKKTNHLAGASENQPSRLIGKKKFLYKVPTYVLNEYSDSEYTEIDDSTRRAGYILKETLSEFKIEAEVTGIRKGPVITMFEILPSPGVKLSKIVNLQDNIALRLAASSVRIVAPIPGKHAVGIEIPNKKRTIVSFREIIEAELGHEGKKGQIPVVLGKDITGEGVTADLAAMPHLLIAGSTGSGKSVCVNTLILSILYQCRPQECRLILIDPKIVELKLYNDIPHLLTPVITEPKRAFQALQYCIYEMERRYACLDSLGVRDIKTYNKRIKERNIATEHMPYIVVVIDEFADLMATTGKELESTVARLAAMSRAVGIHLVLATQRPSIDVITGLIKSNIPSRIAFMVASMMDSRIIIDGPGAEKLLGKGDMLYSGITDPFPIRLQGAFVSEEEVEAVVAYVKTLGEPDYIDEEIFFEDDEDVEANVYVEGDDPLFDKAMQVVVEQGKASASYIQRRLKIGYNRAARLVEEMEERGIVGPQQGSKPRELLRAV